MMRFRVTFFNEVDSGRILGHFLKHGFSSSLVDRRKQGGEFLSVYELVRKKGERCATD